MRINNPKQIILATAKGISPATKGHVTIIDQKTGKVTTVRSDHFNLTINLVDVVKC